MKLKKHIIIVFLFLLTNILIQINGSLLSNAQKFNNSIEANENQNKRQLQSVGGNYISLSFDTGFQADTCWYSRIQDKISQVSINYEEVTSFPSSFEITEGNSVQIHFNSTLIDLSYFLSYDEDLEEANIPTECRITDHFKNHIVSIDLSNFDASSVASTAKMFKGYTALTTIYFFYMETSNIVSMNEMFSGCTSLSSIDLSGFIKTNVLDVSYMFSGCSSLKSIQTYQFNNFDTSTVINMSYMFSGCTSLESFDFSIFSYTSVENMEGMFHSCYSLETVSSSYISGQSIKNMNYIFYDCISLKSMDLSGFDTSNVETMNFLFHNCSSLQSIGLTYWDVSNVVSMEEIFSDCSSLITLEIPNFFMQQLMESNDVFKNVDKLRYLNIENMKYDSNEDYDENTCVNHNCNLPLNYNDKPIFVCQRNKFVSNENVYDICCYFNAESDMCDGYNYITLYYKQNCNYANGFKNEYRNEISFINYNNSTFLSSSSLNILSGTKLELHFYESATTMKKFFSKEEDNNMINVISIDFSFFDSNSIESMESMFYGCNSLESVDFSNFFPIQVNNMANVFYGCSSLKTIDNSEFVVLMVETMNSMFYGCSSLESIPLFFFEDATVLDMAKMFEGCKTLISIDFTNFKTENVENMNSMFAHCIKLQSLNLSNFDTSEVKTMDNMFYNCTSLEFIDISNFNLSQTTSTNQMFTDLKNLKFIDLYNTQDNGFLLSNALNTDNTIKKIFFVCQKTNIITHPKAFNCCNYFDNDIDCDYYIESTVINEVSENTEINGNTKLTEITKIIESSEIITTIINMTEYIYSIYKNIIENMGDQSYRIIKSKNLILHFSTVYEQLHNKSLLVSSVDLGECETLLREQEGLNDTEQFLMIKLDIKNEKFNSTYVQYEIFNPRNYSKVSLDICKNVSIKILVPVMLDELNHSLLVSLEDSGYNAFDINDDFYNDICSTYKAENGADMTLSLRKTLIYDSVKDIYLCQSGCEFGKFDAKTSNAHCICKVQESQTFLDISKISFNKTKFFDSFYKTLYNSNFRVIKCIELVFSLKGMKSNYGSYIMTFLSATFIAFIIIHIIKGQSKLINIINYIIKSKGINENNNNIEDIKSESNKKFKIKTFINDKNIKIDEAMKTDNLQAPTKKRNNNIININKIIDSNIACNTNEEVNKEKNEVVDIDEEKKENNELKYENQMMDESEDLTEVEINNLEYEKAILIDKRTFCQFYISLIKREHLIIFSFFIFDDFNLYQIKVLLFIVSFSLFFTVNAFFFSDETMDKIYEDNGVFNFAFQIPQIIYSSLITSVINIILNKLSITENQILDMKKEKDKEKITQKVYTIKKYIKIKLIIFLSLSSAFMLFFWYFISCFCSVYKNTQFILIEDTLISFIISMILSFGFQLLPGLFRIQALRAIKKDKKYQYKISTLLNIL